MNKLNIVVVGGGTAGWMSALALLKLKKNTLATLTVIESQRIGSVGVGEATIPTIKAFHQALGIDEQAFIRATNATYKLGIQFENWGPSPYIHPFGEYGKSIAGIDFHQVLKHHVNNSPSQNIDDYSLPIALCKLNKFSPNTTYQEHSFAYAYHLDAKKYAVFLQQQCQALGAVHISDTVSDISHHANGHIQSVTLSNGKSITGDLFIDCTGFKSLLLRPQKEVTFENWQHWLPSDTAIPFATPTQNTADIRPYTRSIAHDYGWRWEIPLASRTGNGYIFSSQYLSEEQARKNILHEFPKLKPEDLRPSITFKTGRYSHNWKNNVVAIGLSAGFLEPLESTSIYLIQAAIMNLVELLPEVISTTQPEPLVQELEFNLRMNREWETVRDFLILHYKCANLSSSPFWEYCKHMDIPATLAKKIALYKSSGSILENIDEIFLQPSWLAVFNGQNVESTQGNIRISALPKNKVSDMINHLYHSIQVSAQQTPDYAATLLQTHNNLK
ncbi:tryptophan halogenase family protein [Marinagarivorans algicola]|uniref:tryptophan halogenase family protein n=1 Tax=Marinagarivorans algicola TaxID=1513270 RepID=UPI0006B88DAD|nr:tryptophan halogenase family protein [Marinagarivorans algicola]